jgi:hypothetical protein
MGVKRLNFQLRAKAMRCQGQTEGQIEHLLSPNPEFSVITLVIHVGG